MRPNIRGYMETVNDNPKPFRWIKSAEQILASIKRFCLATLEVADNQAKIVETSESGR